jgi:hypothetical protein
MYNEIGTFLLVLSVIFCLRHLIPIIIEMMSKEPNTIKKPSIIEIVFLYLASSFIITWLINLI